MSNFHEMNYTDGIRRLMVRIDHELDQGELIYVLAHWHLVLVGNGAMPTKAEAERTVWYELDRRGRTSSLAFKQPVSAKELEAVRWAEGVVAEHWPAVSR